MCFLYHFIKCIYKSRYFLFLHEWIICVSIYFFSEILISSQSSFSYHWSIRIWNTFLWFIFFLLWRFENLLDLHFDWLGWKDWSYKKRKGAFKSEQREKELITCTFSCDNLSWKAEEINVKKWDHGVMTKPPRSFCLIN